MTFQRFISVSYSQSNTSVGEPRFTRHERQFTVFCIIPLISSPSASSIRSADVARADVVATQVQGSGGPMLQAWLLNITMTALLVRAPPVLSCWCCACWVNDIMTGDTNL